MTKFDHPEVTLYQWQDDRMCSWQDVKIQFLSTDLLKTIQQVEEMKTEA